jgi:hypothetical protein
MLHIEGPVIGPHRVDPDILDASGDDQSQCCPVLENGTVSRHHASQTDFTASRNLVRAENPPEGQRGSEGQRRNHDECASPLDDYRARRQQRDAQGRGQWRAALYTAYGASARRVLHEEARRRRLGHGHHRSPANRTKKSGQKQDRQHGCESGR